MLIVKGHETNWREGDTATLYWCGATGKEMKAIGKFSLKDGSKQYPLQYTKDLKSSCSVRFGIAVENTVEKQRKIEEQKRREEDERKRKEAEREKEENLTQRKKSKPANMKLFIY
jgi:hypothetical protein